MDPFTGEYKKEEKKMKKTLSLILALVLCLSLCACAADNNTSTSENNKHTEEQVKEVEKPILLSSSAESLASGYVSSYSSKIKSAAISYNREIRSISAVQIGSVSESKETDYSDGTNMYEITIKGTFYGKDDFGDIIDKYKFTWTVEINYIYVSNNWASYRWSNDNIKISE